jgi:hypothetical protein
MDFGCEHIAQFDWGDASAGLLITIIQPQLAQESNIQWLLDTLHNTQWMDYCQLSRGSVNAIPAPDVVDVEKAYGYCASCEHCIQWQPKSYG